MLAAPPHVVDLTAFLEQFDERKEQFLAAIPMGRFGTPWEIAEVAVFLASGNSSYMTGQILHPDGGFFTG